MKIRRGEIEGPLGHYLEDLAVRALLRLALALPYETRVRMMGWLVSRVIAPLAGYDRRVRDNLAHVMPELPEAEVRRLMRAVADNAGRTLIEIYSGRDFIARMKDVEFDGPGVAVLREARDTRRPVILLTGHFGNYDVPRAALIADGYDVGSLYNPMRNRFFNAHYVAAISKIGQPMFPRGRKGYAQLLKHLKSGGMIGFLVDVYMPSAPILSFFGKPARTALSAAELALKYDALLVPIYGVRQPDGLSFRVQVEAPVPHGTPEEMTQALNDSLEAITRQHMEQWFWIHRRWKPERIAKALAREAARAEAEAAELAAAEAEIDRDRG
ncbi:lysophospholipid acyltransferase family protein [Celeribacter indicus]|uniref:Lipid A biosynthesis acyltransferase n=1 Tax=Celeribacter indicus TaxID=1208324 RepID=A0A0B5DYT9_9RHOB|nr:lauroyl acyltransferase [Celeribacter indicus]AJE46350.1 Lipid A biosynthesis acyltransferase [Celeribacter indicus]SDW54182.1 KDO2-lipid IV(A) lauroyltransferase [Celeribacter indicus]